MKRLVSLTLAMILTCSMLMIGANAATGNSKTFSLKSGDSMTISNYVEEKTEEMVIDGEKTALTYYLVDDSTQITFKVKNERISGDYIGTELDGDGYMTFSSGYIGGEWGWDSIKAIDILTSSMTNGTNTSYEYYTLGAISMADFDNEDFLKVYVMKAGQQTQTTGTITATPTASKVLVNGKEISFDAYTINQNNYFKLRDIASVLSGTNKQFEVTWNSEKGAIEMLSNQAYTSVGGELAAGDGLSKTPVLNTAKVYLDGKEVNLTAYTINGNNYFKLRDLGQLFNFGVSWNGAVVIDTSTGYADDTQSQAMTPEQQAGRDAFEAQVAAGGGGTYQSGVEWMEQQSQKTGDQLESEGFIVVDHP